MSKIEGDPGYRGGWCVHYRAPFGPGLTRVATCEAGVEYDSFKSSPMKGAWPCFLDKGKDKPGALPCQHLRRPTAEEIEAHEIWFKQRFDRQIKVMQGIADWRKQHKGKSHQEVVACPACEGRLHLSISSYNGHVHGRCETKGCVSWME